jgi:3-oxoacyl-[acyl-carrier protein] reductase
VGALLGRTALVTGASRGIGKAIALALAAEGANVAVNFRSSAAQAEAVAAAVRDGGARSVAIQADVSDAVQVARLVGRTQDELGEIDILVNNAGINRPFDSAQDKPKPLEEISERDWNDLMSVNLKSCFLVTQATLPSMRARQWGRIINLSSVAAQIGGVVGPHYAASKAGIHGMTHFYASRLAREGITVNAIAPALIETEMVTSNPNATADLIPVGRFGAVDEVARVAVMLATNGYITGQTINVNGGWYPS